MSYPLNARGTQLCVTVRQDGVTVYGNKVGFENLARWLAWIADSRADEHYECHIGWHLESHHSSRRNVWVVADSKMRGVVPRHNETDRPMFEVTFMRLTTAELSKLRRHAEEDAHPATRSKRGVRSAGLKRTRREKRPTSQR